MNRFNPFALAAFVAASRGHAVVPPSGPFMMVDGDVLTVGGSPVGDAIPPGLVYVGSDYVTVNDELLVVAA